MDPLPSGGLASFQCLDESQPAQSMDSSVQLAEPIPITCRREILAADPLIQLGKDLLNIFFGGADIHFHFIVSLPSH